MSCDVSLIIPFKNASCFVDRSIKNSLKIIKKVNAQIIYIDNNSTDNSIKKIKNKIKKKKNIILLKTKKNIGPGLARNLGIKKAKGKKILFLDIDDSIIVDKLISLIQFSKSKDYNLIYFGRILIKNTKLTGEKLSNFLPYNSNNLIPFFRKNNNMNVIFVLFEKKFITKNKLYFDKGLHEDIFFLFKAHFYNKKKIGKFIPIVYKKYSYKNSIIHTLSLYHLKGMYVAWKNIDYFLKSKLSKQKYALLLPHIQYRLRGEMANEYKKILNFKLDLMKKKFFLCYILKSYKKLILTNFAAKTKKDVIVSKILNLQLI